MTSVTNDITRMYLPSLVHLVGFYFADDYFDPRLRLRFSGPSASAISLATSSITVIALLHFRRQVRRTHLTCLLDDN